MSILFFMPWRLNLRQTLSKSSITAAPTVGLDEGTSPCAPNGSLLCFSRQGMGIAPFIIAMRRFSGNFTLLKGQGSDGFTLIELLVATALLGLLAGSAICPALYGGRDGRPKPNRPHPDGVAIQSAGQSARNSGAIDAWDQRCADRDPLQRACRSWWPDTHGHRADGHNRCQQQRRDSRSEP
jgi:prepilin-type N-terminal cleavage/methylation domain-containing protein